MKFSNLFARPAVFACAAALAASLGVAAPAKADWAFPSLAYSADEELGPVSWTGFIISPEVSFFGDLQLSGSGSAFVDDLDGAAIGGKIGYDKQLGNVVVGIVTDAQYSFADGDGRGGFANTFDTDLNYYGTVRGRLGYAFGRWMVYGTAGYAYGELEIDNNLTGASSSQTLSGWAYGGGLEYVWNKDITLRAGYWKLDFDEERFTSLGATNNEIEAKMDVFDFGLVHRF